MRLQGIHRVRALGLPEDVGETVSATDMRSVLRKVSNEVSVSEMQQVPEKTKTETQCQTYSTKNTSLCCMDFCHIFHNMQSDGCVAGVHKWLGWYVEG